MRVSSYGMNGKLYYNYVHFRVARGAERLMI